jgi:hypothetical protein
MRISEITTCVGDPDGNLKGFKLKLCDPNDSSTCVDLPWMGEENRDVCYTDPVPGPITSITTTNNGNFVNSIVWRSGDWVADYSIPGGENKKTWTFDIDPVMGMFGKLNSEDKIKQLGWIMLDKECQTANKHWN